MYYFACIEERGICYAIEQYEEYPEWVVDNPFYIQIDSYDASLITRKKYIDGEWIDTTPNEAENSNARTIGIDNIWLDDRIYGLDDAIANHSHDGYASQSDLDLLEDVVGTKANTIHTHNGYASSNHTHVDYALQTSLDALETEVDGKANATHTHTEYADISHTHTEYAQSSHTHNNYANVAHEHGDYSLTTHTHTVSDIGAASSNHNHDSIYASINHNHDTVYATSGHDHDENYAQLSHSHSNYATTTALNEIADVVSSKANTNHSHGDLYYTEDEVDNLLSTKSDTSHNHTGVYDDSGSAANALISAKAYTDSEIETLGETVSAKANTSDLTSHSGDTTIHITSNERTNWNAAKNHADSAHAPSNAQPNQNAFSNIVIGSTIISADNTTDTLTLVAGNNITLSPDATGDGITISSENTVYTHPTSAGNKHVPAGGSSGQILRWVSDGTATWGNDNNTTYSNATQTTSGLMSNTDKTKLDGVASGANNYTLPSAGANLGGVKSGGDVTISAGVITINDDSHNHVISNIDGLQSVLDGKSSSSHSHNDIYYTETEVDSLLSAKANSSHTHVIEDITNLQATLNGKAASSHGTHVNYSTILPVMDGTAAVGTATTVARSDHKHPTDTSRASQTSLDSHTGNKSNPHGVSLTQLGVTATASELNYVDGVTSSIQTQLNSKAESGHTHSAATTSASGFMTKDMVSKLNGIATGANAYTHPTYTARTGVPTANQAPAFGGTFTVSQPVSDGTGHITAVNSRTITIPSAVVTDSSNGLMSKSDKAKLDGMVLATVSEVETYLGI